VTFFLDKPTGIDPNKINIEIPQLDLPSLNFDEPKR
jgi:hypothetical protein